MSGVSGSISFSQAASTSPTVVKIKLDGLEGGAGEFHVHVFPMPINSASCASESVGGHFNPEGVPWGQCSMNNPHLCEVGDLSGKSGISLAGLKNIDRESFDSNLPLYGPNGVVGKSIVIHKATGENWVCANIVDLAAPTPYPIQATPYPTLATPYPTLATPYLTLATPYPIQASTVGEMYLTIPSTADQMTASTLAQLRGQLAQHLSPYATISAANVALVVLAGSVVVRVTLSGENLDGYALAKVLEQDIRFRRLDSLVIGCALATATSCPHLA